MAKTKRDVAVRVGRRTRPKPPDLVVEAGAFDEAHLRVLHGFVVNLKSLQDMRGKHASPLPEVSPGTRLNEVTSPDVEAILEEAAANGMKRESLRKIRSLLHRICKKAVRMGLMQTNPAAIDRVEIPDVREVRKERVILTDEEIERFVTHPVSSNKRWAAAAIETKMMVVTARLLGGMRGGDVIAWDWSMIDRVHFAEAIVPRMKTKHQRPAQRLALPVPLANALRMRWTACGKPEAGPVFPVEIGENAGQPRAARTSFAKRLRRELFRAGIIRHACTRPADAPLPTYTGRVATGASKHVGDLCCPNMLLDPLYAETATTRPTDFHSVRRAYDTGLARAGVNIQQAMLLSGHSDAKVHMRYVQQTDSMRILPEAAMPRLPVDSIVPATDKTKDAPENHALSIGNLARPGGLEPTTRGLEGRCSIQLSYGRSKARTLARASHRHEELTCPQAPCPSALPCPPECPRPGSRHDSSAPPRRTAPHSSPSPPAKASTHRPCPPPAPAG